MRKLIKKLRPVVRSNAEDATDDQKDAYWLDLMIEVRRLALTVETWQWAGDDFWERSGKVRTAMRDLARDLACKANETAYFEREIEPQFQSRVAMPA